MTNLFRITKNHGFRSGNRGLRIALDFEILHRVFEHTVVFQAVYILIDVVGEPLGMSHFTEDSAVGEVIPSIASNEPFGL